MSNATPAPVWSPDIRESILRTCRAMFAEGQVIELRALGLNGRDNHSAAGWFNDFDALAAAAESAEAQQAEGIYVTLNPVHAACLARSPNKLKPFQRITSSDREIERRQWLPIDLDPVRPSKISSSKGEIELAHAKALDITAWLEGECGWPRGLRAFSSNGIHLLYRIDLAADEPEKILIRRCVNALSEKFSDAAVKIDTTVFNAARIWKLWGTVSRKGASIADRPHRRSFLLPDQNGNYPVFSDVECLAADQLAALAELHKEPERGRSSSSGTAKAKDFDLGAFIERHKIAVARDEPWDGTGRRFILEQCIFDASHTGSAAVLGRSPSGAVFYKCQHDSCASRRWIDVKEHFEPSKGRGGEGSKKGAKKATPSAPRDSGDDAWGLARDFLRDCYQTPEGEVLLRRHRDYFFRYRPEAGVYEEVSLDTIKTQVTIWVSEFLEKTTVRAIHDVIHCIGANVTVPDNHDLPLWAEMSLGEYQPYARFNMQPRRWISMKNGILDIDALLAGKPAEKCVHNPSSKWLNTVKLEYDFDVDASCNRWQQFLDEIMEEDEERIAIIQEAFGYCLWDSTELERFFILVGSGQNGKSTMMNILEAMLGRANVSFLSPSELEDRFMRAELYGKLANICTDMDDVDRFSEKLIKKICSGETIIADRKFRKGVQWQPRTKLFFATNVLPRFVDITQGIWRRAIIVPFDVQIPNSRKDTRLLGKLKEELPGIFLWSVQGMIRLLRDREFTYSLECDRVHREYKRQCFPILTFLDEETELDEEGSITMKDLYQSYKAWCSEHGLTKPKPLHMFARDVYEFRKSVRKERVRDDDGEKATRLAGLYLKRPVVI